MASTFGSLEIAKSGLSAGMQGINVTAHNITNVDTLGYSRQRIVQASVPPSATMSRFTSNKIGRVGGGTTVVVLDQIRSEFYDKQYRTQNSASTYWTTKASALSLVEGLFGTTWEATMQNSLNSFFGSFNVLAADGTIQEYRVNLQQSAINMCTNMNTFYNELVAQMDDLSSTVSSWVDQINTYAENIAALNQAIARYEINGQPANDLRDQLNLILDEMSAICDVEYYTDTDTGQFVVKVAGRELVNGSKVVNTVSTTTTTCSVTGEKITLPQWSDGREFNVTGGELAGIVEMLTSTDPENPGLPYFIDQLNILARAIVELVNDIHCQGYTYPDGNTGINFFDDFGDISQVNAGNICLSAEVAEDIWNIALSSTGADSNGDIAAQLYDLLGSNDLVLSDGTEIGGFLSYYDGIQAKLDTVLNGVISTMSTYNSLANSMDTLRLSISGVSLDEEMTNLIQYQYAYQGASRVITTLDEALDLLINRMGVVGRS